MGDSTRAFEGTGKVKIMAGSDTKISKKDVELRADLTKSLWDIHTIT
jgi:hypothetical protein